MDSHEHRTHLIVVGSSAGGIDALSTLVTTLPPEFPAPIVIAQHLEPSRPSHLEEILARRSTLPVRTAHDGSHQLQPGVVYVVPPNRNVRVHDSRVDISASDSDRIKPSVDMLLSSAAEAYGDQLIAVILSGSGSDGAAGAREVKRAGGTVIIQNPETAPFPGMPLSLAPTSVDIVANVERIGPILRDLLAGVSVPARPDEARELEQFLEGLRAHLDIDFTAYKMPTIRRRLQRRIVATDTGSLSGYAKYLLTHPEEYSQLASSFLINVTDFFRDPDVFESLRKRALPELIDYARRRGNELRIWSAGCATGEEAYSLGMLLAEILGESLDQFNVRIFATDVDAEAIAFARRGVYPVSALVHVPQELRTKYFTREDDAYQIRKRVRGLVVFGQHDLAQRAPFPRVDMVVCRNVLIYFTPELQQRTLQLFAYSLRDGGYLVLAKSEGIDSLTDVFAPIDKQLKIYRRHGERFQMPPGRAQPAIPATTPTQRRLSYSHPAPSIALQQALAASIQHPHVVLESVLQRLLVGVVIVDRHYDIQEINPAARKYFSIHGPAIGDDLIHLAQGIPYASLRQAIDTAFRTRAQTTIDEFAVEQVTSEHPRYLQIRCYPDPAGEVHSSPVQEASVQEASVQEGFVQEGFVQEASVQEAPETVVIVAYDITSLVEARHALEQQMGEAQQQLHTVEAELASRNTVIERLTGTNRQLLEANQELTDANETMRTSNEHLVVSTEEAQAATEEVETLNEELQATNEELETLNEELQATIEELNTTNDDLHARQAELQNLARIGEEERARLEAILASMADGVVVVDGAKPLLTNAAYDRLAGSANAPFVPCDANGRPLPPEATPLQRATRGETFSMEFTITTKDGKRRWFEAEGQPIHNLESGHQAVVVMRDVTERRSARP